MRPRFYVVNLTHAVSEPVVEADQVVNRFLLFDFVVLARLPAFVLEVLCHELKVIDITVKVIP